MDAVMNLMTLREVVVRAVGEVDGDKVREALQLGSVHLVLIGIDLCIGERAQLAAVVCMFVGVPLPFLFSAGYVGRLSLLCPIVL